MKTLKLITLLIIYNLTFNISHAQSPVNSVGSGCSLMFDLATLSSPPYDRVEINPTATFDTLSSYFTVEVWFKSPFPINSWQRIVSKYNHLYRTGWVLNIGNSSVAGVSGKLSFAGWSVSGVQMVVRSSSNVCDNKWHHGCFVYNKGIISVYVDGVLEGSQVYSPEDLQTNTKKVTMGAGFDGSVWWKFKGQIDEVRIWNYARTQTEIQRDMCRKLTGNEPGLLGYWRFDDCGGLTATDASGNGNNGTLY